MSRADSALVLERRSMVWRTRVLLVIITVVGLGYLAVQHIPMVRATLNHYTSQVLDVVRDAGAGVNLDSDAGAIPASAAREVLDSLPVKGRAPATGYARTQFGEAWTDNNDEQYGHNGCRTRDDILARDLTALTRDRCQVLRGDLMDPYTSRHIQFVRGPESSAAVQIDHIVALKNAWVTGAQQISARDRVNLANDPLNLLAVDGPSNQAKGDGDAATWLPPNKRFRCAYVIRQLQVKRKYHLWVTSPEKTEIGRILTTCP